MLKTFAISFSQTYTHTYVMSESLCEREVRSLVYTSAYILRIVRGNHTDRDIFPSLENREGERDLKKLDKGKKKNGRRSEKPCACDGQR